MFFASTQFPTLARSRKAAKTAALVDDVERIELVVVLIVKPGAFEVKEPEPDLAGERERVDRELLDRLDLFRIGFVVEDVDHAVSYLHDVDVSGNDVGRVERERDLKAERVLVVADIVCSENDRHFNGDGGRIVHQHELLHDLVSELVGGDRLENELRVLDRGVLFGSDLDAVDVELWLVGRGAGALVAEKLMRGVFRNRFKVFTQRAEGCVPWR